MTEGTRAKWSERIREWQRSGLSAEGFTAGKGYAAASLRWAASRLGPEKPTRLTPARLPKAPRRAAESLVPPPGAPRFVPVRMRRAEPVAEMVVEVGSARIRVTRGVDITLLGDVVRALQGVVR